MPDQKELFNDDERRPRPKQKIRLQRPDQPEIKIARMESLSGDTGSGLWTLHFQGGASVYIESGYGVRALARAFGATGADLHEKIRGQVIQYSEDNLGVMEGFTPHIIEP